MKNSGYIRWAFTEIFFILSVFSAVMFGMYASDIQTANHLSTTQLSIISGSFFVIFALSQLVAGQLVNQISPKLLLGGSALIAGFGALVFANSSLFAILLLSRVLLGIGLGCTFLGVLYIVQTSFSENQFAFFSSLSQSLANVAAGLLALFAAHLFSAYDYAVSFSTLGILLIACGLCLIWVLPRSAALNQNKIMIKDILKSYMSTFTNRSVWTGLLYFSGLFGSILIFADLFSISYQVDVFHISQATAIAQNSMVPVGVAIGGIISGWAVSKGQSHRKLAMLFSLIALIMMQVILFVNFPNQIQTVLSMITYFMFGLGCGGAMLAFIEVQAGFKNQILRPIANSLILTGTYLVNGLLLQPLIGSLIGNLHTHKYFNNLASPYYHWLFSTNLQDVWYKYDSGLVVISLMLLLSVIVSLFFRKA